jgi:hypothetical protein
MEPIILDNIPFQLDIEKLTQELRIKAGSPNESTLRRLLQQAQEIGRPRAIYKIAPVELVSDDCVLIEGREFKSRVMRVNLESRHRVFLYVATCGMELYDWEQGLEDSLEGFYAFSISGAALDSAREAMHAHMRATFDIQDSATMNPGSLEDWPIEAQEPLFALLGDPEKTIGVRLLDSLLMVPNQSVSGLRFETDSGYINCQLCPREGCPDREAPYDNQLYTRYFRG